MAITAKRAEKADLTKVEIYVLEGEVESLINMFGGQSKYCIRKLPLGSTL